MKKELGSHLGITLLFDLKLFARSHAIHPNPQTLAASAYLKRFVSSFKFSQHIKGPMIRYFSSYLKLKVPVGRNLVSRGKTFCLMKTNNYLFADATTLREIRCQLTQQRDKMQTQFHSIGATWLAFLNLTLEWVCFGQGVANRASFKKKNIATCEMIWVRCVCCILSKLPYLPVAIYVVSVIIKRFTAKLLCELLWRHL